MRIRKIKYNNHPVLGNLELDLVNPNTGLPYDTIVFAGENGTGKTSILESLSTFLNKRSIRYFERIEYEANGTLFAAEPLDNGQHIDIGYYKRTNLQTGAATNIHSAANNSESNIDTDLDDLRHYGCIYTKVRSNYTSQPIKGTTASELDKTVYDTDSNDDFTSLKQLLVDIDTQDNRDLRTKMDNPPAGGFDYVAFRNSTRMHRFQHAFDTFFELIKFNGVEPDTGNIEVFFEKHGQKIKVDKLSTGEKQIVFRGAYLLRNIGKIDGAAIMIDEPELSMHPQWQKRILKYFKDLFIENGTQKAQLFFATHSEYVLGEALNDTANTLVVVLSDNSGTIVKNEVRTPFVLPTITASEINYIAFSVFSTDFHIALYGYLQTLTGNSKIEDCDNYIVSSPLYDQTRYGYASSYRSTNYQTLSTMIRNHIDHPDNGYSYNDTQLKISTLFLIELINEYKRTHP